MAKTTKAAERRVVIDATKFEPADILALSKLCDPKSKAVTEARAKLPAGVQKVDVTVRVFGDIEVGTTERVPVKFEGEKYLIAALAALSPDQRKRVLKQPRVKKDQKAIIEAELKAIKLRLPRKAGPAKLTPHLTVERVVGDETIFEVAAAARAVP
jgi:hypothetical protein